MVEAGPTGTPRVGWANVLLAIVLSVAIAVAATQGLSSSTMFSIVAQADTLSLRPGCGSRVVWDLPRGAVYGATVRDERDLRRQKPVRESARPVSLSFGEDHVARITLRRDRRLQIGVRRSAERAGEERSAQEAGAGGLGAAVAMIDGVEQPRDPSGYDYVSLRPRELPPGDRAEGSGALPLTLRLVGRVVIGEPIPEGSGGRESWSPTVRTGQLLAYNRAWFTGERLSLLTERLDPGSVIDTHPTMNNRNATGMRVIDIHTGQPDCRPGAQPWPAVGYVRDHPADGLEVVLYRNGPSVGLAPLGGDVLEIGLTWWSTFTASPVWQISAATLLAIASLCQALSLPTGWWPRLRPTVAARQVGQKLASLARSVIRR